MTNPAKPIKPVKHYLQFSDLDASEYAYLFARAALIKQFLHSKPVQIVSVMND